MKYNDTTNRDGIIQEVERLTDLGISYISSDNDRLKDFTAMANKVLSRVWHLIWRYTGNWKYDDANNLTLPIVSTDLIKGKKDYLLRDDILAIKRVSVLDTAGNETFLTPILKEQETPELVGNYYSLINNTITLYFEPENVADGLIVAFDREDTKFNYNDTDKEPGFSSPYHQIIPLMVAIDWLKTKQPKSPSLPAYIKDQLKLEEDIKVFYNRRFKDFKPRMTREKVSYK